MGENKGMSEAVAMYVYCGDTEEICHSDIRAESRHSFYWEYGIQEQKEGLIPFWIVFCDENGDTIDFPINISSSAAIRLLKSLKRPESEWGKIAA